MNETRSLAEIATELAAARDKCDREGMTPKNKACLDRLEAELYAYKRKARELLEAQTMNFKESCVGEGKVYLLSGGGKVFTDIAARFVRGERSVEEICDSPYSAQIVKNILDSGHLAATEFDFFVFGIEGFSRVTEAQLIRKRHASYLIKSGRVEHKGRGTFSVVYPYKSLRDFIANAELPDGRDITLSGSDLMALTKAWYEKAVQAGYAEEDVRYWKPQATEFKAIIGMNAHALLDWFSIRCCLNAQHEIRNLAYQMLNLCKSAAPDLFSDAGPNCKRLGYCPENQRQNWHCKEAGLYLPKDEALKILQNHRSKHA